MLVKAEFSQALEIWQNYLWKDRKSDIESHSAMLFLNNFDLKNFDFSPTYFVYKIENQIAGVNSGHKCIDNSYRSRGLYVFPKFRGYGIGKILLINTINQGKLEHCSFVWSYPRYESWKTYASVGFSLCTEWTKGETGTNAFCKINL